MNFKVASWVGLGYKKGFVIKKSYITLFSAPKCKANEEFSTCSNAICRAQYCADKDKPVACPAIAKGYCKKGCVCKEHYLRDKKGNCIPEKECKPNDCKWLLWQEYKLDPIS